MMILPLILLACDSEAPEQAAAPPPANPPAAAAPPPPSAPPPSANPNQLSGYQGTFANDPRLSPTDVAAWGPGNFRVKRNEIFARYGRAFQSEDLQQHFGATGWYAVNASSSPSASIIVEVVRSPAPGRNSCSKSSRRPFHCTS